MRAMKYVPIIKTGDAEMRGLENLSGKVKDSVTPLIELTRSRTTEKLPRGDVFRRVERLIRAYDSRKCILDLTSIPDLSNEQIETFLRSHDGYANWVDFIDGLKSRIPSLIPTIQLQDDIDDIEEIEKRFQKQVSELSDRCEKIAYRIQITDEGYGGDLDLIGKVVPNVGEQLICIIDCDFVPQRKAGTYAASAANIVDDLAGRGVKDIVVAGTSFPQNPTQYGGDADGSHDLEEATVYAKVKKKARRELQTPVNLIYGDYACINPNRNDQKGGNAWVPRIDVPAENSVFYRRSRREKDVEDYTAAYTRVARTVVRDKAFKSIRASIGTCWGIRQIQLAAEGEPQGLSPSFWIAVRMNIHITMQSLLRT